jgi:hypothetical protein
LWLADIEQTNRAFVYTMFGVSTWLELMSYLTYKSKSATNADDTLSTPDTDYTLSGSVWLVGIT